MKPWALNVKETEYCPMMSATEKSHLSISKGWGILSQLIYPPFLGLGLGWLIEKKIPSSGLWMLGLMLLFFIAGLYGIIKSYLLELAQEASKTNLASVVAKQEKSASISDSKELVQK
jgi:F0F1-type ATP synthase assembly protein I